MKPIQLAALNVYSALAAPYRRARLQRLAAASRCPISVLFYHRVADDHPNGWTITTDQFRRHLDYCQANFEIIDLAEVQRRIALGQSAAPAVAITFDDGYRDNCDFAIPELIRRQLPCTYFVTVNHVRDGLPFRHDVDAGHPLPVHTGIEVRQLADAGIEIGCHTQSHVDFSTVSDPRVLEHEIVAAKAELEQLIGRSVRYFAFPYGLPQQVTPAAVEMIHQAGFAGYCTAFGGYNHVGQDSFHIRRCHGDPEFARLRNWLTYDPRKARREPRIYAPVWGCAAATQSASFR